jgi:hypothetical protein
MYEHRYILAIPFLFQCRDSERHKPRLLELGRRMAEFSIAISLTSTSLCQSLTIFCELLFREGNGLNFFRLQLLFFLLS